MTNRVAYTGRVMRRTVPWLADRPLFTELGLLALTVVFGLQAIRVLVPGVVWLLGDRVGFGAIEGGGLMLLVFLTAFLAGPLRRLLGNRLTLAVTAGGLGLLRLLMQALAAQALASFILAIIAAALFILFLPPFLRTAQVRGRLGTGHLALGLLAGLTLDTAIQGGFGTYDIAWQTGVAPLVVTLCLVLVQWVLLWAATVGIGRSIAAGVSTPEGYRRGRAYTWLAIGPFLFLELVIFQNVARLAVLTGWPLPWAFGWTLAAQALGLAAATWALSWRRRLMWPLALLCGLAVTVILALPHLQGVVLTAVLFLAGQVLLSVLIAQVFVGIGAMPDRGGFSGLIVANGLGMILLLILLMGYYAVYNLSLPYSNTILEPVAAVIVGACAVVASVGLRQETMFARRAWFASVLGLALLIVPLVGTVTWHAPAAVEGDGFPVRVMTYNLHNGFDTEGRLGLEALASVIEDADPDIVALQEVSRGWVVSGRVDMIAWLSQRLDLPYVFGPTADPYWGNAILSRYPVVTYAQYELPPRDLFILRGFTVASIDVGNGDELQVIATHYHHLDEDTQVRQIQSEAVVDFWGGSERTVFLGDLNARPEDAEMEMLRQAGLVDAATEFYPSPPRTFPSYAPDRRIDYIWVSPDLWVNGVEIPQSTASDHLAVVVDIDR